MSVPTWLSKHLQLFWRVAEQKTFRRGFMIVSALVLFIVGLPVLIGFVARFMYQSGNYTGAQQLWRLQGVVGWYDKDVPYANAGLAYYQAAHLTPSIDRLEQALTITHPARECRIRWNLAVALDHRANERSQSQPNDAVGDYARAINILNEERCTNDPHYRDKFQQFIKLLTDKMEALIKQINERHQRPEDANDEQQEDQPVPDDQKTEQQTKQQNAYQNSLNEDRYRQQSDEEKNKGYTQAVW